MCGFAGFLAGDGALDGALTLKRMAGAIAHRGPDDEGIWLDGAHRIGLAHRRLSILDLSAAGHQPMQSPSGRFVIAYNGEIYNYQEMRDDLESRGGTSWRGHSDTETLLAGFDVLGIEETLRGATGMFAFALWDRDARQLILARDRLGEKPLYYGWQGHGEQKVFLFGSDLAALRTHAMFENEEDPAALSAFLQYGYVPTPKSIYKGMSKLGAGELLRISIERPKPVIARYWDAAQLTSQAPSFGGSPSDAVDELERILSIAVGRQMIADVPIGAFLSGGVDSSTIVALMQAQSARPIRTFSIGFGDHDHNEAVHAAKVAKHLGTDHTELYVTPELAMSVIPKLASIYSEPFADSSQVPVYLVSELARKDVTVSLSGDAGDELFGGYNRYTMADRYHNRVRRLPMVFRRGLSSALGLVRPSAWNRIVSLLPGAASGRLNLSNLSEKIPKIRAALRAQSPAELYAGLTSLNRDPASLMCLTARSVADAVAELQSGLDMVSGMMARDLVTYLPDDILCKVDRAAMAVSLETRVPMLDHSVVEFAWSLPLGHKIRDGVGKWPLREVLYRHVPKALIERPKTGFAVPIDAWLRGPLRGWAEDLLLQETNDLLDASAVGKIWDEYIEGGSNMGNALWPLLMYRSWRLERLSA